MSSSRSSSSTSLRSRSKPTSFSATTTKTTTSSSLIGRTSKNLPLSAGVADQLEALEKFRARDSTVKKMVTNVTKKAAAVAERGNQRQLVDQWNTTWNKLKIEVGDKENDFSESWANVEDNLFELMNLFSSIHNSNNTNNNNNRAIDDEGLLFLRRQMKLEGDMLKKCFEMTSVANSSTSSPAFLAASAIKRKEQQLLQQQQSKSKNTHNTDNSNIALLLSEFVSQLRIEQDEKVNELEKEIDIVTSELMEQQTTSINNTKSSSSSSVLVVTSSSASSCWWFTEPIHGAPSLSKVTSEWLRSYEPLRNSSPELFAVFSQHQESQQIVLDEIAKAAAITRDALLESASSRDVARLWDLWKNAPKLAPGGKSKRERVLAAAKAEFKNNSTSAVVVDADILLDLLLTLRNQKQQLREKYSSSLESVKDQMKRLDDVVIAFQTLQEAEAVHSTFLTQLEHDHAETKDREAKLRNEKEILEATKAAEVAIEQEKENKRLEILREKQRKDAEAKQEAVAKWLQEKTAKQRQDDEAQLEDDKKNLEIQKEQLDAAKERVKERAQIDAAKMAYKLQQQEILRQQQEADERRLLDFYAKADEKVGVTRDVDRARQVTASLGIEAALPTIGESTAVFSRTGHGFSTDKVVKDARFRLVEALSVAGLANSSYGRSVFKDSFAPQISQHLVARSMGSNFSLL